MGNTTEEIIERLIEEDEEFKKTYRTHREYDRQIKKLDQKVGLTPSEQIERKRLQKLKLSEKDRMEAFISHYRSIEGSGSEERQG
ncbi:MAG: YdcH family protein [Thermodesulfobacteriota bacterium]